MNRFFFVSIWLTLIAAQTINRSLSNPSADDNDKTVEQYITGYGYPFQQHYVTTSDNYVLTLWRIPCRNQANDKCTPVFFQHGVQDTGFSFLFQDIEDNLPIKLYHLGYDIWIGNIRGNRYSLGHTKYDAEDYSSDYWEFTYDEMAKYDLPAMLNYVKANTKADKIKYICHSQGCAIMVALGTMEPLYVESIINTTVAFAPAVYLHHHESILIRIVKLVHFVELYLSTGLRMFLSGIENSFIVKYAGYFFPTFFRYLLYFALGPVTKMGIKLSRIPVLTAHLPGGTSANNMIHFLQAAETPIFQMHDYGKKGNLKHYGKETPPPYDMSNWQRINMKWRIVYGEKDAFIPKAGIMDLVKHISRGDNIEIQGLSDASHADIYWANYASKLVFPQVIDFLRKSDSFTTHKK